MSTLFRFGSYSTHMLLLTLLWHLLREDFVALVLPISLGTSLLCIGVAHLIEERRRHLKLRLQLKDNPLATQGTLFLCAVVLAGWFVESRFDTGSLFDLFIYCTAAFFWSQAFASFANYLRVPA
jgi:hypothetical protein